jgi:hypothetical protein
VHAVDESQVERCAAAVVREQRAAAVQVLDRIPRALQVAKRTVNPRIWRVARSTRP